MEVDAFNAARHLVEADVVEALKARSAYCPDAVVWHEEVFFPAHEDVLALLVVLEREGGRFGRFGQRSPGWEARPMLKVDFFRGAPGGVCGFEEVFGADDFAFEECG